MRVLVTRSAQDASRTRAALEAAGHEVVLSSVLDIVALEAAWPAGVVDAVLATSAHAFEAADIGPPTEARRVTPLFLVGERTRTAACARGWLGAATVATNAAALALVFGTLAHRPRRLVYLAGHDRKPDAEAALASAGQAFDVVEVYEARGAARLSDEAAAALQAKEIDAVLHYSRRSAELFGAVAQTHGLDVSRPRHLCLSGDVAGPLRARGLPLVEVAEAPHEAALHALLA